MRLITILILTLCFVSVGCGYVSSGTWNDDDRAWNWAFGESIPDGVTVNHSKYWSSAHFTSEYIWHFDLTLNAEAVKNIESDDDFKRLTLEMDKNRLGSDDPAWFLPNGSSGFDVYRSISNPDFKIYLNPITMRSYWTSMQL